MLSWLTGITGSRPLGLARVVLGGAAMVRAVVALPILVDLTRRETLLAPYAEWTPRPSLPLIALIAGLWMLSAVLFTLGWRVPVSGSALMLALVAVLGIDQQTYSNHLYLMLWLVALMVLADAGAGLSIRGVDRPVVRWPLLLLKLQLSVVYVFAALTKINDDFLSGAILAGSLGTGVVPFPGSLRTPQLLSVLAGIVVIVEFAVGILIWHRRYRFLAFALGVGFHLAVPLSMQPTAELIVFSLEMLALYPLFLDSERLKVGVPDGYPIDRLTRYDVLRLVTVLPDRPQQLTAARRGMTTTGTESRILIMEQLVPWLWVAPLLRLPPLRQIYDRASTPPLPRDRTKTPAAQ